MNTVETFLLCTTPSTWVKAALQNVPLLLVDHAHCEKKAASNAIAHIFRYTEHADLVQQMSRLAREELRHFEQVTAIIKTRGETFTRLPPSRYGAGFKRHIRSQEPYRLVDELIVGAFIEARSCERFAAIAPYLEENLGRFYRGLLASEARHYAMYLNLAQQYATETIDDRVRFFAEVEAELILSPDRELRFHSGIPLLETAEG